MHTMRRPLHSLARHVSAGILGAALSTCGACADDQSGIDPYSGDTGVGRDGGDATVLPDPILPNDDRDAAPVDALDAGSEDDAGWEAWVDERVALPTRGYWTGLKRELLATATDGFVALACHNCYVDDLGDSGANLAATLDRLRAARRAGFDLLEVDVKEEGGVWFVDHNDAGTTTGALVDAMLFDGSLMLGNRPLFLEIKETLPTAESLRALVDLILASGFGVEGREVILRSFENRVTNLDLASQVLAAPDLAANAPHFRLHIIFHRANAEALGVDASSDPFGDLVGLHIQGVELNPEATNTVFLLQKARERGLGTNVFNFFPSRNTMVCAEFNELSDAITFDGEIGDCLAGIAGP